MFVSVKFSSCYEERSGTKLDLTHIKLRWIDHLCNFYKYPHTFEMTFQSDLVQLWKFFSFDYDKMIFEKLFSFQNYNSDSEALFKHSPAGLCWASMIVENNSVNSGKGFHHSYDQQGPRSSQQPFSARWQPTKQPNNRVILVQACPWPVWEGSLLQF